MDPYLEAYWGDVHTSLVTYARNQLQRALPAGLVARVEEYVAIDDELELRVRHRVPDVQVSERRPTSGAVTAVLAENDTEDHALILPVEWEPQTQREVRIIDQSQGGRLVTVIEILSPTNKSSGRRDYRAKQEQMLAGGVNLVEIDLLRDGEWIVLAPQQFVPSKWRSPYKISVFRAVPEPGNWYYAASFKERLPPIRIPLRPADPVVRLDLQALVDQAYADAGYDGLDYSQDPSPPLSPADAEWVDQHLRQQGKR